MQFFALSAFSYLIFPIRMDFLIFTLRSVQTILLLLIAMGLVVKGIVGVCDVRVCMRRTFVRRSNDEIILTILLELCNRFIAKCLVG